jgi:hypothetical protein
MLRAWRILVRSSGCLYDPLPIGDRTAELLAREGAPPDRLPGGLLGQLRIPSSVTSATVRSGDVTGTGPCQARPAHGRRGSAARGPAGRGAAAATRLPVRSCASWQAGHPRAGGASARSRGTSSPTKATASPGPRCRSEETAPVGKCRGQGAPAAPPLHDARRAATSNLLPWHRHTRTLSPFSVCEQESSAFGEIVAVDRGSSPTPGI